MEPYTLNKKFLKEDIIDGFTSLIWTERYYGDGEVELVVPATPDMIKKLIPDTFLGETGSDEVMLIDTVNIDNGKLKVTGKSLLTWFNNRFIRTSPNHQDRYWYMSGETAGQTLWSMIYYMCSPESPYLNGTYDIGIPDAIKFAIPGLGLKSYDATGSNIEIAVEYGPLYDTMKQLASTFNLGMQLTLESATDTSYFLGFRSYKGLDRTSTQMVNPFVRFSPQMDSFKDIREVQSSAAKKTLVYTFAPGLNPEEGDPDLRTVPGVSTDEGPITGFDLRALQVFVDDVTTDMIGGDPETLVRILNGRAEMARMANRFIKAVDGEIVPTDQFKYGVHYNLGDTIEVQGNSGALQPARVTEYIRAEDTTGQKSYPTVEIIV